MLQKSTEISRGLFCYISSKVRVFAALGIWYSKFKWSELETNSGEEIRVRDTFVVN